MGTDRFLWIWNLDFLLGSKEEDKFKMILNLCLICHDSASNYEIGDIHSKKYLNFKLCLETILKRRVRADKFQEKQICALYFESVKEHQSLEEKIAKICEELCTNFQRIHPTKRGRKKK